MNVSGKYIKDENGDIISPVTSASTVFDKNNESLDSVISTFVRAEDTGEIGEIICNSVVSTYTDNEKDAYSTKYMNESLSIIPRSYIHDVITTGVKTVTINFPTNMYTKPRMLKVEGVVSVRSTSSSYNPNIYAYFNDKNTTYSFSYHGVHFESNNNTDQWSTFNPASIHRHVSSSEVTLTQCCGIGCNQPFSVTFSFPREMDGFTYQALCGGTSSGLGYARNYFYGGYVNYTRLNNINPLEYINSITFEMDTFSTATNLVATIYP